MNLVCPQSSRCGCNRISVKVDHIHCDCFCEALEMNLVSPSSLEVDTSFCESGSLVHLISCNFINIINVSIVWEMTRRDLSK